MKNNNILFKEREVTHRGKEVNLYPDTKTSLVAGRVSYVIPLDFGNVYVVRFSKPVTTTAANVLLGT